MAAKYQFITELYQRTAKTVSQNPQAWQNFLSSACRNYKCRFDQQVLIYAQRPDAVAVAELEVWNKMFRRWVNKNSKGIAVFDPKGRRNTLKYYFDISDTHEGYYGSRPVPIWQMNKRYEQQVCERLSDRFGEVEGGDLASVLMETAKNAVEDNLPDYLSQLKSCTQDSFLEELDELNIEVMYRRLATNSVAFMLLTRCGLDTGELFEHEDFADIINFNTPATLNAIGIATSDIAEMALREISQTIRNVQIAERTPNRTFAPAAQNRYDVGREQPERSEHNERNHLQQTGGLSYSRPNITDRARNSAWQIRYDAQGLSGTAPESDLSQPVDIGQAERTSARSGADGTPEVGASDEAARLAAGRDGGTERESADAVGRSDEQYPQSSGGSDTGRADLPLSVATEEEVTANLPTVEEQIETITQAEDEKSSAFSVSQEDIDSVLQRGSGIEDGKYRIYRQFQKNEDSKSNIEFLKKEYGIGGGTHDYPDGIRGGEWHDAKGIGIEKNGSYTNPDLRLSWSKVEKRLRELIQAGRYLNPKEREHYPDYLEKVSAPQYEVDTQRKILRQNFISAHRDLPPADKRDTLALRLSDFIRDLDGYEKGLLSEVERTDLADVTAEQMEQHLSDPATVQQLIDFLALVQGKTSDVFSRSNAWRFGQELMELHPLCYLYHVGDTVYIGADQYEISELTEESVWLQNVEFPLFGKEMSREELEEKLRENPANDHLKVVVTERQSKEIPAETKPDSLTLSIGFSEHPAFYDRELNDRFTELSFALGNRLLGVLDEKQHREREAKQIGWYHKTDFTVTAVIGGEDFRYEGRFDIGDGEGDLIAHIKNYYNYCLSPNCPFIPEWKRQGEDYYREQMETLRFGRDVFIPFLEQHTELTAEDEKRLDEIMATESDWYRKAEEAPQEETPHYTVEQTSDAFDDPFIIRDNTVPEGESGQYYEVDGIYQTLTTEEEAQEYADTLNSAEKIIKLFAAKDAEREAQKQASEPSSTADLIGKEVTIDNRRFVIERIGEISGDVSLRDITFQNATGFPINRVEKIGYIRRLLEQAQPEQPPEEKTEAIAEPVTEIVAEYPAVENGLPYDIVVEKIRFGEPEQTQDKKAPTRLEERRNYRITDDALGVGGAKEKFRRNLAAIHTLHDLEIENRLATPEEQEILARYVGWGGLPQAFDQNNAEWANEYRELKGVLSDEEYRAAMESTLTAFYTPPVVIKAMYEVLDRLGFSQGNLLEPCCGVGNFFGLLPESMEKAKLHGVEIDPLSGRIARQLYQKANIAVEGFEKTKLPDNHFDVVIGNVPFGEFKVDDSRYNAQKFLIHDYFFAKALDKVRAGGVVLFITSKGTMDKASPEVRKYIAQRAELLGAIRLPDNTFRANAGTEVTSDILILQKRDRIAEVEPEWVHLDTDENGVTQNSYFVSHPEMVLGEMKMESTRFGYDSACKAYKDIPLSELLHEAVQRIDGEIPEAEAEIDEISDGRKLALDQRLIDPMLPDDPNSKVNACVDNVYRIWEEHADTKAAQLVFCDLSTPKNDGTFNVYDDMREKLIGRGIPAEQIRYIHEASTDAQKKELFAKVRSGEVRVLLGSTQKMGAGTNVQDRLIAIHNLDCPWRPSDLEQRQGRVERQGNMFPEVQVYRYVTEQTFDAYLYQLVESKQKFISQIMSSKSPVRSAEDVDEVALSFAEVKMLATGDVRFKEKMDLDIQVSKLKVLKQSYLSEHYSLEDRILKYYPKEIKACEERIAALERDIPLLEQHKPQGDGKFCPMTLNGMTYTEKADAGQMLLALCKEHASPQPAAIGSYRGFRLEVSYDAFYQEYRLDLCGSCKHRVSLGSDALGNLTRIENKLAQLPADLQVEQKAKAELLTQLGNAKVEVEKPFAYEDELREKSDRLNALNIELNLDEKDPSVLDAEPEQSDEPPERKCANWER